MSWRVPTVEDLIATLSQDEVDVFRRSRDFGTEADPAADLLNEVSEMVRGYCRKNYYVRLSPVSHSIPESLMSFAMDICAWKILKRLPIEMKEPRKIAYTTALEELQKVAKDEIRPESYVDMSDPSSLDPNDYRNVPFLIFNGRPDIFR